MTTQESQDFDSIVGGLPAPQVGDLQKAKCREFVKKVTHNDAKTEKEKISNALGSWLRFMKDKLTEEGKKSFKEAVDRMLSLMQHDGRIKADTFLADFEAKLQGEEALEHRKAWLSCWSDMFTACDRNSDNKLAQEEAQILLLAFNVPQEFSEALFDLLCDEVEETLDRRTYLTSMNEYFFTDDKTGIFGELFSDRVQAQA